MLTYEGGVVDDWACDEDVTVWSPVEVDTVAVVDEGAEGDPSAAQPAISAATIKIAPIHRPLVDRCWLNTASSLVSLLGRLANDHSVGVRCEGDPGSLVVLRAVELRATSHRRCSTSRWLSFLEGSLANSAVNPGLRCDEGAMGGREAPRGHPPQALVHPPDALEVGWG